MSTVQALSGVLCCVLLLLAWFEMGVQVAAGQAACMMCWQTGCMRAAVRMAGT